MKKQPHWVMVLATASVLSFFGCGGGGGGSANEAQATAAPETNAELQPESVTPAAAPEEAGHTALLVPHEVTFYGWPDNSPAGAAIQSPQIHQQAGGTGTYDDPVTFASSPEEYPPGTKLYVPYLKKYVVMEDRCTACVGDWGRGQRHIDIWMNSDDSNASELKACQKYWTRGSIEVELNPPHDRPVDATPLFNPSTASCRS